MRKETIALAIIVVIFSLAGPVSASSYDIEIHQVNDNLLVEHVISLDSTLEMQINIPSDARSITSKQNYSLEDDTIVITGKLAGISYFTNDALQKSDEGYYLVDNLKFNFDVDNVTIKIFLDEGYFLDNEHIYPTPSKMETDGRQISLTWKMKDVKSGQTLPIFLTIFSPFISLNLWIWMAVLAAVVIIIYISYRFYTKRRGKEENLDRHLIESEKAVLRELRKADRGELWQKQLQLKINFSKAKLSRVIRNLESRNLVEKIPYGNTNKVRLK